MDSVTAPSLTVCQHTMLVAIFTDEVLDTDQLLSKVPYREPAIGVEDIAEWFGELQVLLDRGLVVREPAPHGYAYRATMAGGQIVYAHTPLFVTRGIAR